MKNVFFILSVLVLIVSTSGIPQSFSIRDAWWYSRHDTDCDGYYSPSILSVDVDVDVETTFQVRTIARFFNPAGLLIGSESIDHSIHSISPADSAHIPVGNRFPHGEYVIIITVEVSGVVKANRGPAQDPDLDWQKLEMGSENNEHPYPRIDLVTWSDELDPDHDGYVMQKNINITVSATGPMPCPSYGCYFSILTYQGCYGYQECCPIIYSHNPTVNWSHLVGPRPPENTHCDLITFGEYDFEISCRLTFDGGVTSESCWNWFGHPEVMGNHKFETEEQNNIPIECNHIDWADPPSQVDQDGDGYRAKDILYINTGSWSDCYYKVYYKLANQTEYTYYAKTKSHILDPEATISQPFGNPNLELPHGLYDLKLELYNTNTDHLVATYDEKTDPPLNDQKFERSDEDESSSSNVCLTLNLIQGWNMFSLNVIPENPNIATVLASISSKVTIAKSGDGKTWIPKYGINDIGEIKTGQGYQLYMKEAATVEICGMEIEPSTAIPLPAGWSLISYLPRTAMSAATALASIQDQLLVAKNNDGQTYIPAYGINLIDQMQPGQGYQVYLKDAAELVYPAGAVR
ncbi:hypothetical protein JXO59_13310 [candidate division KSB1 bacterium]|nr:hypothetical protein [candidate division KSB1 bacterium]